MQMKYLKPQAEFQGRKEKENQRGGDQFTSLKNSACIYTDTSYLK